jgi:peptidoglycan/xylan/chitin deacetylase (PgdA/CDA1 family)
MYHWISGDPGQRLRHWGVTPEQFASQVRWLHEEGFRTLTLDQVVQVVKGLAPMPERGVALTFDDGYRDFLEGASQVLTDHGFTATLFLVADRVGMTNSWDDRHGDPPRRLLSWSEAGELARRGFEIGSHARTHRPLPTLSDGELDEEIGGSKAILEDRLGLPVRHFSYPHGELDGRCLRRVRAAGYASACSDRRGDNRRGVDPFLLKRSLITCHEGRWSFSMKARTGFGIREWSAARWASLWKHPGAAAPLRGRP